MFHRERPKETTDTILEKLQRSPLENVVIRIDGRQYLIPTSTIKLLAWNSIPDAIKDENSEAARKMATARTGIKALIRPMLPEILRKTWGQDVEILPRLNILSWLPVYLLHFLVNVIASKEWVIHVEKCTGCEGDIFKVTGLSPDTNNKYNTQTLPTPQADNQPIPGGSESSTLRTEDSHIS